MYLEGKAIVELPIWFCPHLSCTHIVVWIRILGPKKRIETTEVSLLSLR